MAATTIANLQIVPSKFAEYILERTTEKSALVRSGIAVSDPTVSQIINGSPKGGNIITMRMRYLVRKSWESITLIPTV